MYPQTVAGRGAGFSGHAVTASVLLSASLLRALLHPRCVFSRSLPRNAVSWHSGMQPCKWIIQACDPLLILSTKTETRLQQAIEGQQTDMKTHRKNSSFPGISRLVTQLKVTNAPMSTTCAHLLNKRFLFPVCYFNPRYQKRRAKHSYMLNYIPACIVCAIID